MKKTARSYLTFCMTLFLAWMTFGDLQAQSQPGVWESLGPSLGDIKVTVLLVDPNDPDKVFAGTEAKGIFLSNDGGASWQRANRPMNFQTIRTLIMQGDTLHAGTDNFNTGFIYPVAVELGAWYSTNGGIDWSRGSGIPNGTIVNRISAYSGNLFAGTAKHLYTSSDGGVSWNSTNINHNFSDIDASLHGVFILANDSLFRQAGKALNSWTAVAIESRPNTFTSAFHESTTSVPIFVGHDSGILISQDGGDNWADPIEPNDLQEESIVGMKFIDKSLYAWTTETLFVSGDSNGAQWNSVSLPDDTKPDLLKLIGTQGWLYASTPFGVYRHSNNGATWDAKYLPPGETPGEITAIAYSRGALYAGSSKGEIFLGDDIFSEWFWIQRNALDANDQIRGFFAKDNIVFAYGSSTLNSGRDSFSSINGGKSWQRAVGLPFPPSINHGVVSFKGRLYAGTGRVGVGGSLYRSNDGGLNWENVWPLPEHQPTVKEFHVEEDRMFVGTYSSVRVSSDGLDWTIVRDKAAPSIEKLNEIYFSGSGGASSDTANTGFLYRSSDGIDWEEVHQVDQYHDNSRRAAVNHLLFAKNQYFAGTFGGGIVFSSEPSGRTWKRAKAPVADLVITDLVSAGDKIFAAANFQRNAIIHPRGIYFTSDGENWEEVTDSDINLNWVNDLLVIGNVIYAGTGNPFQARDSGVFLSHDGMSWLPLDIGVDFSKIGRVNQLGFDSNLGKLYASTTDGLYVQNIDLEPPVGRSISLSNADTLTNQRTVSLVMIVESADSMMVSSNKDFLGARWQPYSQTLENVNLTEGDGVKRIYTKFKDLSWNETKIDSVQITLDQTKPRFLGVPRVVPSIIRRGGRVMISQQYIDTHPDRMELWYRRGGQTWNENLRSIFEENIAEIDSGNVTSQGLDYRIIAFDKAGNTDTLRSADGMDFFSLPIQVAEEAVGNSGSVSGGTGGNAYQMISIPAAFDGTPNVKELFGDLGKYGAENDWRLFAYNGGDSAWQEGEELILQSGAALFVIFREGRQLTNMLPGTTTPVSAGVRGEIPGWQVRANDWTALGNPYNFRVTLSQLKLKNADVRLSEQGSAIQVWAYDGSWKNASTDPNIALEPWSGLMVRSATVDTIVFAYADDPFSQDLGKLAANNEKDDAGISSEKDWSVQLIITDGQARDAINFFGIKANAEAGLDDFDWYEPPFLPGGSVALNFPHPAWEKPVMLTADYRPPSPDGHVWEVAIRGRATFPVSVEVGSLENLPDAMQLLAIDEGTGMMRDLRKSEEFSLRIPISGERRLKILAGNEGFIFENTSGLLAVPTEFALQQNYPNPFNPSTTIRYQLPVPGRVSLHVFDMMGRQVLRLEDGAAREIGYHEVVADMRGLASGMYFYRLNVTGDQDFQAIRKMMFIK